MQGDGTGIYTPCCALGQGTRMGTHTMESSLLLCCLLALVIPASSLKCHTCVGDFNDCNPTEVTCPGKRDRCSTTALYIDSFPCKVRKVFKGCINSTTTSKKLSISPNDLITLSLQQDMCKSDLCNTQEVSDPDSNQNDLYCYSCITPGTSCDSETMKEMRCRGEQKQCLDMQVIGSFGEIADVNLKGCGQIPACKSNLYFSSQTSSVSIQCCNENYCNSGTETESEDKTPNGIQCYSCNTLDGAKCSPEEVVKAQCYGSLTYCLEVAGVNIKDEHPIPTVIKGCATKSMCDSSVLPLLQKLGTATVKCCKGSLCNNQFTESGLIASGYVPIGNDSPETGNNTAGSGNNSSAGTSGSSSFGGYTNMPGGNESSTTNTSLENDAEMTDEWNNSNHSSKDNIEVPLEYANSGNVTGMTNEWNNSNDSNHNLGYNNIFGNNNPSTSYTGNGTGMSNEWSKNNSSNHNMSVSGGYANNSGSNYSSISHTSSGIGTGMTNEWINNNHSYPNLVPPGGNYGSFNSNGSNNISNSNYSSNFMMPHNGSTYGNGNSSGSSWDSIESYLNHMSSGANNNGSYFNTSSWPSGSPPGKHSFSNETGWMYSLNNVLNAMPNNSNNGSSSNHNNIQNFLSTLNGYIHGNGSKNITEWIQNDSFFSNLMPPGMNHNGSAPSGYNINSLNNGTINDYFNRLGISLNNSNIPNIMSILSGGNNGSFNISKFASGWSNIMYNPNLMNPHANHNGSPYSLESIPSNSGSSYSNIQNPNLLSPGGSTNTNGSYLGAGFNGQPSSNTNGMSSGGYHDGSINGNGHYSYVVPPGGDNTGAFFNNGSNSNMIPGVGSSGTSHGGASVDGNGYNSNLMGHGLNGSMLGNGSNSGGVLSNNYNPNELVPGRSTNDSAGGGGAGDENGSMFNSASSFWTKSWSIVIFSAIALMVLN